MPLPARKEKEKGPKLGTARSATLSPASPGTESAESASEEMAREVVKLLTPKFDQILGKLEALGAALGEMGQRVDELEQRVSALEDDGGSMARTDKARADQIAALLGKVDDLENRSRRNNIRIVGIPETTTDAMLLPLIESWLPNALGLSALVGELRVERAHRIGPKTEARQRPRVVIARILNFQHKAQLLQAYRSKRDLQLDNQKLLLFQDYSAAVAGKRKEFAPICSTLFQRKVRFTLAFPAVLRVTHLGQNHAFASVGAAKVFLETLSEGSELNAGPQ